MQIQDEKRFKAVIATLAEAFDRKLSEQLPEIYWQALEDLTIEDLEAASARAIRELKFFPRPADLRDFSGKLRPTDPYADLPRFNARGRIPSA